MNILLIGGNGYVGSLLYSQLQHYHNVTSYDLCLFGEDLGYSKRLDLADLCQSDLEMFDWIVCLAAHSSVPLCKVDPQGALQNNMFNMIQLTQQALPNQKIIYASSTSVYGTTGVLRREDQESWQPHNYYDITKLSWDQYAKQLISYRRPLIGLRFGTICGTSPNTREDLFLNSMTSDSLKSGELWVNNLHSSRSVLTVQDATSAIIHIIESNCFTPGIFNLKSFDTNMEQASLLISQECGSKRVQLEDDATSYNFTVDSSLFQHTYGWTAQGTLRNCVEELRENLARTHLSRRDSWPGGGYRA